MWNKQTTETLDENNPETFVVINVVKENISTHIQYGNWSKIRICFNLKARKLKGETRHGTLTMMELLRAGKILCKKNFKRVFSEAYTQFGNKEVVSN